MSEDKKIRHHFVPVFYLKGFCSPTAPKQLWVYDKKTEKVFSQNPRNVGYEKRYHTFEGADGKTDTNTIEDYLAKNWEEPASGILREILAGKFPKGEHRQLFANFMGLTFTRVKNHRANFESILAHDAKHFTQFSAKDPKSFAKMLEDYERDRGEKLTDDPEELRQDILKGEYEVEICPEFFLKKFIDHGLKMGELLNQMRWVILKATDRYRFLTSDNPLFFIGPTSDPRSFYNGVGLANKNVEVTFPLSREFALFASWEDPSIVVG